MKNSLAAKYFLGMKKVEVVFIPLPAMGHIIAAVEMAKLFVGSDDRISASVLMMKPALDSTTTKYRCRTSSGSIHA
jgi:hypothetical protein